MDVTHEVKTGEDSHTHIHVSATVGDVTLTHVMTVGAVDGVLPVDYSLQKDLDAARQYVAALAESRARAQKLAAGLL